MYIALTILISSSFIILIVWLIWIPGLWCTSCVEEWKQTRYLLYYWFCFLKGTAFTWLFRKKNRHSKDPGTQDASTEQNPNWLWYLEILALCFFIFPEISVSLTFPHLSDPVLYHNKSNRLFRNLTTSNCWKMGCWDDASSGRREQEKEQKVL